MVRTLGIALVAASAISRGAKSGTPRSKSGSGNFGAY